MAAAASKAGDGASTTAEAPVATVALAAPVATVALALRSVPSLARCIMRIKAVRTDERGCEPERERGEASVFREVQQALRMLHGACDDDDDDGARRWSRSLFAVCARRARSNEALTFDDVLSRVLRATHRLSREAVELVEEAAGGRCRRRGCTAASGVHLGAAAFRTTGMRVPHGGRRARPGRAPPPSVRAR